ncbi:hypothetical protein [Cyanobium sp. L1E-Cus]|uniref:hypothetical protein n=1 Tax=Cyanobium sp. L1E-Cus TaxID=2823714 RepID=UPI0020CF8427|nr:hypothetical protein [Cyanobium sp. L1E-Cus]MCP9823714.1 hypothetical protein [Cyanobium sp. L1E-Cus]
MGIAIVAKSCFPLIFYYAAIAEISETRPLKHSRFYRTNPLIKVAGGINNGHPQLFHGKVPIKELHAIPILGIS